MKAPTAWFRVGHGGRRFEFPAMAALPPGWSMALSHTDGTPYYITASGQSQYEFPDRLHPEVNVASAGSPGRPATSPRPEADLGSPLPAGWDAVAPRPRSAWGIA
jgi:hypothetical protein